MSDNTVEPELFNEFIDNLPLLIYSNLHKNNKYDNYTKIESILEKSGYNIDKVMAKVCKSLIADLLLIKYYYFKASTSL